MSKKLKIQFWKAEKALAMQILDQGGLPKRKNEGNVRVWDYLALFKEAIVLGGINEFDLHIPHIVFDTNSKRDAYLKKAVNAITDELFTGGGELKIGEMCEVRNGESEKWRKSKLITILPEKYDERFIVEVEDHPTEHYSWTYARPIVKRIEPKIEECGQLVTYTWEEK